MYFFFFFFFWWLDLLNGKIKLCTIEIELEQLLSTAADAVGIE